MSAPLDQIATIVLPHADEAQLNGAIKALLLKDTNILSAGRAVEGRTEVGQVSTGLDRLRDTGIQADLCIQPKGNRRKSVLVCDMDSTLIGQECIDELADYAGVKDRVAEITERAMLGQIGFEGALTERVSLLKGLPISVLQRCYEERITLNPGARALARTMAANGGVTLIVSGGFTAFSQHVADACGFKSHQANVLLEDDGTLTGTVQMPILGRDAKREALLQAAAGDPSKAIAIGDGANDLAMIQAAGLGVAYRAKPAVAAASDCAITCTDLRTALYYQGYSDVDILED